jgi:hypothetical protein
MVISQGMRSKIKSVLFDKGFVITFLLSMFFLFFFFGKLPTDINHTYFGVGGDGFQSYYYPLYHVKYDTSYWHCDATNYPYGEQVFFTGCQPFIANGIKLISTVIDISNYTLGILNSIMLISIVLSALCLFLIFDHFCITLWISIISSVAIAFLSPQIIRMIGHYSLSYEFAIPLFILLLLKFHRFPTIKKSILISLLVFFMAGTHFYFYGFFVVIALAFWIGMFFQKNALTTGLKNKLKFCSIHFFIQIVIPYLLCQLIIFLTSDVQDRTNNPWGFYTYVTNLAGVFFPNAQTYKSFLLTFIKPKYPEDFLEGSAYVGLFATVIFIAMIIIAVKKLMFLQVRKVLAPTDKYILNALFWAGIFALLISFAYPFRIQGNEWMLEYSGPLKQLRGIGRFAWVFYYIINIVAIYNVDRWLKSSKPLFKNTLLVLSVFVLSFDAYYNSYSIERALNNHVPKMDDIKNNLPENAWLHQLNINNYQAIIVLPYFHVGSENLWIATETEMTLNVFIASLKTALPTTMVSSSRVSIGQTFKNIQLIKEPYRKLEIIKDFKNDKPFLVLARESELNEEDKNLLSKCKKINQTPSFGIYQLSCSTLNSISEKLYANTLAITKRKKTFNIDGFEYTDSLKTFVYNVYYEKQGSIGAHKKNYSGMLKDANLIFFDTLPNFKKEQEYTVSFWIDNFKEDLYPRTMCLIECIDSVGISKNRNLFAIWSALKVCDGNKALIENTIPIKNKSDKVAITIFHYDIFNDRKLFNIHELLIKPKKDSIFKINNEHDIMWNNRIYLNK